MGGGHQVVLGVLCLFACLLLCIYEGVKACLCVCVHMLACVRVHVLTDFFYSYFFFA